MVLELTRKASTIIVENISKYKERLTSRNQLIKEFLSEILCTFLLISFGCGSLAQFTLARKNSFNTFLSTNLSWSTAVTVGILVGGKVSGAHMNPAISFSMLLNGRLSPLQFGIYLVGQSIGAFLGSLVVFIVYLDDLNWFDGGVRQTIGAKATAGIWGTYPLDHVTTFGAFLDQVSGTALLVVLVLAITDKHNQDMTHALKALMIGNAILLIGLSYGMNCGYAVNPVRDFIPRCFTAMAGWGADVFTAANYYFWIPIVAPYIGAAIATFIYSLLVSIHLPKEEDENSNKQIEDI